MAKMKSREIDSHKCGQLIFGSGTKTFDIEKKVFLAKDSEITIYPYKT